VVPLFFIPGLFGIFSLLIFPKRRFIPADERVHHFLFRFFVIVISTVPFFPWFYPVGGDFGGLQLFIVFSAALPCCLIWC